MKDQSGYETSGAGAASLALFEHAFHCCIGDPVATIDRALTISSFQL